MKYPARPSGSKGDSVRAQRFLRAPAPALALAFFIRCCPLAGTEQVVAAQAADPEALFQELSRLSLDPSQVYVLRNARITRDRVTFYFNRGFIGFLGKVAGSTTGAVFSGDGEVLLVPPSTVEKQSLARFTESPVLEEQFTSAYLRFTDQTAQELLARARPPDPDEPEQPMGFVEQWSTFVHNLNRGHSMRILQQWLEDGDRSYFYAQANGLHLGVFQVTVDERLPEAVKVAAVRLSGGRPYADIWCSFPGLSEGRKAPARATPAQVRSYTIRTHLNPDNSLEGRAVLELESGSSADRLLAFELSRQLKVSAVQDERGNNLLLLQNPSPEQSETAARGNDWIAVVLPSPRPAGERYRLTFTYQGNVIADVGNGVLYVGAHGSWYPSFGLGRRATYDLTFEYPERLTLVATGKRVEESSSGGFTRSRWVSDRAFPVAGFNLGPYDSRVRRLGEVTVEVYATKEAEAALEKRYSASQGFESVVIQRGPEGPRAVELIPKQMPPLTPAALLDAVSDTATRALQYFETLFGPFPYSRLAISQIPGSFGQGWPELVYLPTLAFLPRSARSQLGESRKSQDTEEALSIAHEIAHQWCGNLVGWKTYHDQWLSEGFASYAAALQLAREPQGDRKFRELLESYKRDLLAKDKHGNTVESAGPIWLGMRLSNSLDPEGYDAIVYKKACWVLHMLHMILKDPASGSDTRFFNLLRGFVAAYRDQEPSTEDFVRHAEKFVTRASDLDHNRSLGWFFNAWVYGTGIPRYKLQASTRQLAPHKFLIEGRIEQGAVEPSFEMLVPLVAIYGKDRRVALGQVAVAENGGRFRFTVAARPSRVAIDEDVILATVH